MTTTKSTAKTSFTLDNFEGPLDFLLHLIQKGEIDIYDISIQTITQQFLKHFEEAYLEGRVDLGAEFVGMAATLLWQKSRRLLPKEEQNDAEADEELDPQFEVIHQLIDYCRFKNVAKELSVIEEKQNTFFPRGVSEIPDVVKPLGIEDLSLKDLAGLFEEVLAYSASREGTIEEEEWRVADKVRQIRKGLRAQGKLLFSFLFSPERSRGELIVTFLSVLELMKLGEITVVRREGVVEVISQVSEG